MLVIYQEFYFSIFSTSWFCYFLLIYLRSRRTPKEGLPGCGPPTSQIQIETTQIFKHLITYNSVNTTQNVNYIYSDMF
jgi:hypothetical protein